ncbi:ABC transporter permease [Jeotgalicoccus sp. FSL K6-3177]|uniref:ABC transporter permease n=1 Tax=Jeotgalicoccus sp. FSL K6-3177 TaxID=2921494 RepID=UPI0030FDCB7E
MRRKLHVYLYLLKISFKTLTHYRMTTFLVVAFGFLFTFIDVLSTIVFFQFTEELGGFNFYEVMYILGVYNFIQYSYQLFFINSHEELADKIIEGELDYDLIRPIDSNFLINFRSLDIPSLINFILPISIIIFSILNIEYTFIDFYGAIILIFFGTILYYYINQVIVNLCFWIEKPGMILGIPEYLLDIASRPASIYPKYISFALTFVMPMFVITNSSVIAINSSALYIYLSIFLLVYIIIFRYISNKQWKYGLKKYLSTN